MLFHAANQNQVKPEISVLAAPPFRLITDFLGLIFRAICRLSGSTGSSTNYIILACLSVYHSISPFFLFFHFLFCVGIQPVNHKMTFTNSVATVSGGR